MQLVVDVDEQFKVRLAREYVVTPVVVIAAVAAAFEPLPPLKLTVGAEVYPVPPLHPVQVMLTDATEYVVVLVVVSFAVAVAAVHREQPPPPPLKLTVGVDV